MHTEPFELPLHFSYRYNRYFQMDLHAHHQYELYYFHEGRCNFIIGMPLGDDIMLNYQTSAFHDTATIRQLLNLRPSPEFNAWLEKMGIMQNGRLTSIAGDASLFF